MRYWRLARVVYWRWRARRARWVRLTAVECTEMRHAIHLAKRGHELDRHQVACLDGVTVRLFPR